MALTKKGRRALELAIDKYTAEEWFSAKELSDKCGEKIAAATLTAICNQGYMCRQVGSPAKYCLVKDAAELLKLEPKKIKKKTNNDNLHNAEKNKNDEFYTRYEDIELELDHYKQFFKNKIILLPCNDQGANRDHFWKFFINNFNIFGLKKIIAVHYSGCPDDSTGKAYKIWIDKDMNGDGIINEDDAQLEYLQDNGDFRSNEVKALFNEADIIITNPPFSLFKEFLAQIFYYQKQFLLICNDNAYTSINIFPYIKQEQAWSGFNKIKTFLTPQNTFVNFGNIGWITNLGNNHNPLLTLTKTYDDKIYPKYDNFDAINVDKISEIPMDYDGYIGVPVSYLTKHNPQQFEISGLASGGTVKHKLNYEVPHVDNALERGGCCVLNGIRKYTRVFIKRKV